MKNNINTGIVATLVIGLLAGYSLYPLINPSDRKTIEPQSLQAPAKSNVKIFEDKEYGISFEYPASWSVNPSSQVFKSGDVVAVYFTGETQTENTEFYDGARFVVMVPEALAQDLESWVNSRYSASDQVSDVRINGTLFKKVYTCGLGCSTYYHTASGGKIYGINTFAEGSKKAEYQAAIDQILQTLIFPK